MRKSSILFLLISLLANYTNGQSTYGTKYRTVCSGSTLIRTEISNQIAGTWHCSNPLIQITAPNKPTTTVNGLQAGNNTFVWKSGNQTDTLIIIKNDAAAFAGNDTIICTPTFQLQGIKPVNAAGKWKSLSRFAQITDPENPNSMVIFEKPGIHTLQFTAETNCGKASDFITIRYAYETAFAGTDVLVCREPIILDAEISKFNNSGYWKTLSGNATIEQPNAPNSNVSNISEGINKLVWTIKSEYCGENSDTVLLIKNTKAYAGVSQSICSDTLTLNANKPYFGFGEWKIISGRAKFENEKNANAKAQILRNNTILRWEITDDCKKTYNDIKITLINPEKVFAGNNQKICSEQTTLKAQSLNNLPGIWKLTTPESSAIIETPEKKTTAVSALTPGYHTFRFQTANQCGTAYDEVEILNATEQRAYAGEDFTTCTESAEIVANKPLNASGFWTVLSGNATFENSTANQTKITVAPGKNELLWTINGMCGITSDKITVTFPFAKQISAGTDITVCTETVQLSASDSYPDQAVWEALTAGNYEFSNPHNPQSFVSNLTNGLHIFRRILTTECNNITDEVSVKKISKPQIQLINDTTITAETLSISSKENENNGEWSVVQGDAGFSSLENPIIELTDIAYGTNIFRRTVTNECGSSFKNLTVIRKKPAINLGKNRTVCGLNTELTAIIENPDYEGKWSVIKGNAIIDSIANTYTKVTLSPGENRFRYTLFTENDSVFEEISIIATDLPFANAGNDTTICQPVFELFATGNDTGKWNVIDGDISIYNENNPKSKAEILSVLNRNIQLQYVVSNNCGIHSDFITITPMLEKPDAGTDFTFCGKIANLNAAPPKFGNAVWQIISGKINIADTLNATSKITVPEGTHFLRWKLQNYCGTFYDDLVITSIANPVAQAGNDTVICSSSIMLSANKTKGFWYIESGNGNIATPGYYKTKLTVTEPGKTVIGWRVENQCGISEDFIEITSNKFNTSAGNDFTICDKETILTANEPQNAKGNWKLLSGKAKISEPELAITPVTILTERATFVRFSNANNCSSSDTVTVTSGYFTTNAGKDVSICAGSKTTLKAIGGTNFYWSPEYGLNNSETTSPVASPQNTIKYTVVAFNKYNCTATDTVLVTVLPIPEITPIINHVSKSNGSNGEIKLTVENGKPPYQYLWNNKTTKNTLTKIPKGTYSVQVSDVNGCKTSATLQVKEQLCTANFKYTANGLQVQFTDLSAGKITNRKWYFGNGISTEELSPSFTFKTPGIYQVCLIILNNQTGCKHAFCKEIEIK